MTCEVEGQSLLDSAYRGDLFEVVITLLITWYREQLAIRATTLVFCQDLKRNIQEWHIYRCRGLLAVCAKPMGSVGAYNDMLRCQCLGIAVGKSRKATEHEYISYLFKTLRCQLFIHQVSKFLHCKVASFGVLEF